MVGVMAHVRANFSDPQKAEIFARDRGTCCFSGKSLWLLDYQMTPLWDVDWVDHVVPSSRGGKAVISNGVCASSFFNSKKRNNAADNTYFFEKGRPTFDFYRYYGEIPPKLNSQLTRLGKLEPADWYFNRCLFHLFVGLDYLARKKRFGEKPKRSDVYWFKSAWKRLSIYLKMAGVGSSRSFEQRGLILYPTEANTKKLLSLRELSSQDDFLEFAYSLYPAYEVNFEIFDDFWDAETLPAKAKVVKLASSQKCSPLLREVLASHLLAGQAETEGPNIRSNVLA